MVIWVLVIIHQQLDEEQTDNNKLNEKITSLEEQITQLKKDQAWPPLSSAKKKN